MPANPKSKIQNPKSEEAFIAVNRVGHEYPDGLHAIADVCLSIPAGSFIALVGPSGVGKSTLLRIIGGLLEPSSGRVLINQQAPSQTTHPIGIVFQRDNLMAWRTVEDNIRLPLELQGIKKSVVGERVSQLIELVGLSGFDKSYPAQLSGGMAQRVALARALVHEPDLLLLDEPFGALDALTRERMGQELLRIWRAMPVTVFMVTHSIREAVLLADKIVVMTGTPGRITTHIPITLPRPRTIEMEAHPNFQEAVVAVRSAIQRNNS